jgi:bifunctional DNA-binding transcriptional regulator/antitoxin component of YhaV-PrlF toxin-antitoxin module
MQTKAMKVIAGKDLNSAWRISLPKEGCRQLGISPGDSVCVRQTKGGFVVVKKEWRENNS